ncbi:MAG TPA: HD domain-containing protein [Pseudobdellovibrionaceae bacterium]|nr:HD domain-containing protein [Pseudobdellovibrionaceae bacterium]
MNQIQKIKDLKEKDNIESLYLVKEKFVGVGKNGKLYLSVILGDNSGSIDGRVWERVEEMASGFNVGDIVFIKGVIQVFQERKQLIIHRLTRVDEVEISLDEFMMKSHLNPNDMLVELIQIVKTVKNSKIQQLILSTLEDQEIAPKLLKSAAAKSVHHAWVGGLLEHILSMTKLVISIGDSYPFLNKDLLIFGSIFHDIGKVWELSSGRVVAYTDVGRLLGHMQLACELIDKKSQRILGFPEDLRIILKHIILSHHGKPEYGSPKRPKFLEALVVAMVDDLDSKVSSIHKFILNERHSVLTVAESTQSSDSTLAMHTEKNMSWSKYNELYERYFLLEDMSEKFN